MEPDADEDDGFDWESAVADMENMSILEDGPKNQGSHTILKENQNPNTRGAKAGVVCPPHVKLQQKTMLSFIQRSNQEPGLYQRGNQQPVIDLGAQDDDIANTKGPRVALEAAKTWVYPVNVPMRDYQYSIVQTALFSNTLVSLPTGLGKTLIAAVVMYNYFRWFPTGKIVFTAPSRPLVLQQIEACHESVGIPQDWTIDMTGQMNPGQRLAVWQAKRVFFVTPQVFEKDIQSGSCPMQELVCLVVDEAHRAMGNYSYCVVVRKLMEECIRLRILALTATPGSKQVTIQSVVDNLQISCLEYRNEDDHDVKQYMHNRKLELLQVAMDSESVKIRDLFLEVLQPLVNRLCGFGVFYSKDAARLVPFEFLTARDKFRQAPPPGLDPRQYGEVEACFGATITLYHTFKLLFSHGIRPAFEMLREKLQSGPFGRLMGRNEKLQEIRLLMQKHVQKGASSPKLIKLQELMTEHFEANDPSKTRVIIFTNFRESVKDILEALKVLGEKVKAMEFIGQSSGRSSKGQSQKVQQQVLQKFRVGGFNTIVATSIAEEGLDIMEVDLVICFDANVSPLRMIQRMGRTGRKRDGRVIVLASEGAELQGYLKKQAKSKVIGKHMHNGGLHSFNFHSSPRMVPHSIRPEPQLVELSIAKFVPRLKTRARAVQFIDPCVTELTAEEALLLKRYMETHQPGSTVWKPSLIAFPHSQLLPTRVHKVRHSERTICMLIDILQSLHEDKSGWKNVNQVVGSAEDVDISRGHFKEDKTHSEEGFHGATLAMSPITLRYDGENDASHTLDGDVLGVSVGLAAVPASASPEHRAEHRAVPGKYFGTENEPPDCSAMQVNVEVATLTTCSTPSQGWCIGLNSTEGGHSKLRTVGAAEHGLTHLSSSDLKKGANESPVRMPLDDHIETECPIADGIYTSTGVASELQSSKRSSHHFTEKCIYGNRIVSIDDKGYVRIASPPRLPLFNYLCTNENSHFYNRLSHTLKEFPITSIKRRLDCAEEVDNVERVPVGTPASRGSGGYFVASTPQEAIDKSSHKEMEYRERCEEDMNDDSPRLCTLAEQGLVPSSPVLERTLPLPGTHRCLDTITVEHSGNCTIEAKHGLSRRESGQAVGGATRPSSSGALEVLRKGESESDKSIELAPAVNFANENKSVLNSVTKISNEGDHKLSAGLHTPLVQLTSSGNWNQVLDGSGSIQKPTKFRRLRKAKDAGKHVSLDGHPSSRQRGRSRKQKLHLAAALLVDEEAEVSCDEGISADEDDDEDEQGSLQDFIVDQPTASASQGTDEAIDMMAVYRKSLLTQSPLEGHHLPWMKHLLQTRTPTSDDSNALSLRSSRSLFSEGSGSHGKSDPSSSRNMASCARDVQVTPSVQDDTTQLKNLEFNARRHGEFHESSRHPATEVMQSTTKVHERKRKLSFQQPCLLIRGCQPALSKQFDEDDDLFAGLDLDALEVEAVQKSRGHLQAASQQPVASHLEPGKQKKELNGIQVEDLEFLPSFNLGIDC